MSQPFSYAAPLSVDRPEDCFFYHRMAIPGLGEVGEQWDLRSSIDDYLGRFDFRGKRVLDVGAASGFLTFEMEKRGADVVSFDMRDGTQWDIVPHAANQVRVDSMRKGCVQANQRLKNAYWYTHAKLGSKARVYYGDIYDLPGELGPFDVAIFGMILSHLRDPFQALYSVSRLVSGNIIVTNQMMETREPVGHLIPSRANGEPLAWWGFSRSCLTQYLDVIGFTVKSSTKCAPMCIVKGRTQPEPCVSLVSHRTAGSVQLTGTAKAHRAA